MTIIGFSFTKIEGTRESVVGSGSIEINHNINIEKVEKTILNVGSGKDSVLKIVFKFGVIYGNSLGKLEIIGDLIYSDTKEIIEETFKNWEADKKLSSIVNEEVYKFVYNKGIVKSIELSDNLNLPAPIPIMPKDLFPKKK